MENKHIPKSIPKNKKCRCGKKITHHHFLCDECWREDKKTNKFKKNAMEKNKNGRQNN